MMTLMPMLKNAKQIRKARGLTLVELLMALAILGLLAGLALPSYRQYVERMKVTTAIADIVTIDANIERFFAINRRLPATLADVGMGSMLDPWDNPYQYLSFEGLKGNGQMRKDKNMVPVNSDYDLYSMGPDGKTNQTFTATAGRDDIVRASNGGYVGPASDY